jgi:hypothetical protein
MIRKVSHLFTEFEILTFANFNILILFGKIFSVLFVPYGISKITSNFIERLRINLNVKQEYNHLNNNFSKNFEIIKNLTSKKLSGKYLTKQEKTLLKECQQNQTILEHKQEILEEKFSTLKLFLYYFTYPFKVFLIFSTIIVAMCLIINKTITLYNELNTSFCGIECAYVSTNKARLAFENIFTNIYMNSAIQLICFTYLIIGLIYGISQSNIEILTIKNNRVNNLLYYMIIFTYSLATIEQSFRETPEYSFFSYSKDQCDVLSIDRCGLSMFGVYYLRAYINFEIFKYIDIAYSICFISLLGYFITINPIKAILRKDDNSKEII